jgi:hypothetical protein
MKTFFTFCVLLVSVSSFAQRFGTYEIETEGTYNPKSPVYEVWLKQESWVTMKFEENQEGLDKLIAESEYILDENDMMTADPESQDSVFGSDIEYGHKEQIHDSIQKGNSKVKVVYLLNGRRLQVSATKDGYEINILNPY